MSLYLKREHFIAFGVGLGVARNLNVTIIVSDGS